MNIFDLEVAKRVKLFRTYIRYSQKEFADLLNLPYPTYNGYENGYHSFPLSVLGDISLIFNIPIDYFFGFYKGSLFDLFDNIDKIFYLKKENFN